MANSARRSALFWRLAPGLHRNLGDLLNLHGVVHTRERSIDPSADRPLRNSNVLTELLLRPPAPRKPFEKQLAPKVLGHGGLSSSPSSHRLLLGVNAYRRKTFLQRLHLDLRVQCSPAMGRPRELTDEQRKEAQIFANDAVKRFGHDRVQRELGVTQETVDRWRRGEGMSFRNARGLARMLERTLEDSGLHSGPDGRRARAELSTTQGISLAIMLLQAREEAGLLFPNLAAAVRFDEGQSPARRRSWSKAAIVAAAGGAMGDEDLSTDEWCRALDAIDEALSEVRKGLSPPLPTPKKLRP